MSGARKIKLPEYCVAMTGKFHDGDADCDHDYPAAPTFRDAECVHWTCSRCKGWICFEVAQ